MEIAYEVSQLKFRDARKTPPDADGMYCVLLCTDTIEILGYTVDGGWNTHRSWVDGSLVKKNAFDPDVVLGWCTRREWFQALRNHVKPTLET